MKKIKKLYLAGPDVFRPDAVEHGKNLKNICDGYGFVGLFPLDNEASNPKEIYKANLKMIEKCDAVVANVCPFRGPSLDPGTAFEIGYAKALGKPVFLYNAPKEDYIQRVSQIEYPYTQIENFNLKDNLMIDLSGSDIGGMYSPFDNIREVLQELEWEMAQLTAKKLATRKKAVFKRKKK